LAEQRRPRGLSQKELLGIAEALDCELAVELRPRTG
jgi:hypothetical protein